MAAEVSGGGLQVDEAYEFCAPKFFEFMNEESEEEVRMAELWFETALSYAPSPFMPRIKESRTVQLESLCDFGAAEQTQKDSEPEEASHQREDQALASDKTRRAHNAIEDSAVQNQEAQDGKTSFDSKPEENSCEGNSGLAQEQKSSSAGISTSLEPMNDLSKETSTFAFPILRMSNQTTVTAVGCGTPKVDRLPGKETVPTSLRDQTTTKVYTPKAQRVPVKGVAQTSSKKLTAEKIASLIKKPSALKPKNRSPALHKSTKNAKPKTETRCPGSITAKKNNMATDIAQENQAIKKQKLDNGRARQILNVKNRILPHKSKPDLTSSGVDMFASAARGRHASTLGKESAPFVSTAELVSKFQSKTREMELPQNRSTSHDDIASMIKRRPKLTLTRPKEPELETAHRVRAVRVKSSAELEEEMLAKMPKFKARPVNRKILQAPSLPALPRSIPRIPEFQEFHLKTMERASQHAETSSVLSTTESLSERNEGKPLKLTEPRPPQLETSLRARPPKVKSSQELEQEELEKIQKFKARPLNKKIFESNGDLGLFCNAKRQVTIPQEFHFATNDRLGPPATVVELFDKLSLHSESSHHDQQEVSKITIPDPFNLHTEERGAEKERQLVVQVLQKQLEEERARIPKANPYPYTTDYPVIPLKPAPKPCTKPEAFQLESLIRHEEEMLKKLWEKEKMEKEEAERRKFRAQPIMRDDPLPLPEKERKPLTEVQEFVLHVDDRVVHRSEFDKKIKEKELMYKRLREESETARQIEEEKAVKQMRRTMVPHARPSPSFANPFLPQKSMKETTKPKSPNLRVIQRGQRRHASHLR